MATDPASGPDFRAFGRKGGLKGGRKGALIALAHHGGYELSAPARLAFKASFEAKVDPDGTLAQEERAARAEALMRAHMGDLAQLSAAARRQRTPGGPTQSAVPAADTPPASTPESYCIAADEKSLLPDRVALTLETGHALLAGGDLGSRCDGLNRRGVVAPGGNRWEPDLLRRLLTSDHVAGLRRRGKAVEIAPWLPIFTAAESQRLRHLLSPGNAPSRRPYRLTSFLDCGRCGDFLVGRRRDAYFRRYFCSGCGKVYITADALEDHVEAIVLDRLVERGGSALEELASVRPDCPYPLDRILLAYACGLMRRSDADAALHRERPEGGLKEEIADRWQAASPALRRLVIGEMLTRIIIQPGRRGSNRFDPARVGPIDWRPRYADADPRTHRPASAATRGESAEIATSELNPVGGEPRAASAPAGDEHQVA